MKIFENTLTPELFSNYIRLSAGSRRALSRYGKRLRIRWLLLSRMRESGRESGTGRGC